MALYDEGLQRAGEWVSNYIRNTMLPNLNPNPMMGARPPTNMDMGAFYGTGPPTTGLPTGPSLPTGQPKPPIKTPAASPQGKGPATLPVSRPQDEIAMGQLLSVPGYIAKFLVDIGRMALGLPEGAAQQPLPGGPGMGTPSHGYTVAEGGKPEVVNAEGAYFPFERGQVTPLEPRQEGGEVKPVGMDEYEARGREMRGLPPMVNPPTGMAEYEESAARMRTPSPVSTLQPQRGMLPYNERLSQYGSEGVSTYGSPTPDASQMVRFDELGWKNPIRDMRRYSQRRFPSDVIPLLPMQGGGEVSPVLPDEEDKMEVGPERFFVGNREVPTGTPGAVSGDELARQRIYRETPPGAFYSPTTGTVRPEDFRTPERNYYETHPEERQAEMAMDLMRRVGGKQKFEDVYRGLSEYGAPEKASPPHLVQNEKGEYMWATPGSVSPAGIMGKTPEPKAPGTPHPITTKGFTLIAAPDGRTLALPPDGGPGIPYDPKVHGEKRIEGGLPETGMIGTTPAGVKNEAALEGLNAGDAQIVKQLSDYKIPLPTGFALRSPYWQSILARTAVYDTSFDASQYPVRLKLRTDFTSGKAAANIRSLNTAVAHLETLSGKAQALNNAPVQLWNTIANKGLTAVGDKRVTEFNAAATAVESELANVFKGMGASDQEIKTWRENLSTSQSPEQLKGAINTAIQLLGGRLGALQSQYETGLGRPKDFKFLSDKSRLILKNLGVDVEKLDPGNSEKTVIERRRTEDGRILVKYSDGTKGEEK